MLINATQPEELRVAIADGQTLIDLDIEVPSQEQKKANVYKGRITRIEPSLEACFVDFGSVRHGFLPFKEIAPSCYHPSARSKEGKLAIRDALKEGQELIVQVEKEERGNKGAALTTYISLAGRYLVLMPTNPKAGGVSRRISGEDRQDLREQLQQVLAPDNVGIIVRTAGVGREAEELQWDLDYLLQLWAAIEKAADEKSAPFLIYQESNLFIRALRDHLRSDIGEILIDNETVFEDAREFVQLVMPHNARRLKLYSDPVPLFNRFQIESQIESAFARTVHLPSGGSVVIDHTEALLSIDINSARSTKGVDIEDTAYQTNLEAADEIARQLRLRDLGGLIVIDFIDMMDRKHQRDVEERLRHALQIDKARVQTGRISRFGLLEMSRQRLRPSLGESSQEACPRCDGHGRIRSIESLALSILRLVEEESMKENTGQVLVQAPTTVANFLLNEKRKALADIEKRHAVPIVILSNEYMERPRFEIHRVRKADITDEPSYARVEQPAAELVADERKQAAAAGLGPEPAVRRVTPARPAPGRPEPTEPEPTQTTAAPKQGFLGMLFGKLFAGSSRQQQPSSTESATPSRPVPKTEQRSAPRAEPPTEAGESRPAPAAEATRSRSPSRRRTSKKRQPQKTVDEGGRPQSQKKKTKKKPRKKAARKKTSQGRSQDAQSTQSQSGATKAGQTADEAGKDRSESKSAAESDQKQQSSGQKQDSTARKPRRRRSPYKTSGAKQRDDGADKAKQQTSGSNDQSAAPENRSSEARLALPSADAPKNAGSLVEVVKDNKGIYTLKPNDKKPAESGAQESSETKPPATAEQH